MRRDPPSAIRANKSCPKNCCGGGAGVQPNGYCDRTTGKCVCSTSASYNCKNSKCKSICRQQAQYVDWPHSFDKWGWSVCPAKWPLTGLRTDGGRDALYNIDLAKCEKPCEGTRNDKSAIGLSIMYDPITTTLLACIIATLPIFSILVGSSDRAMGVGS